MPSNLKPISGRINRAKNALWLFLLITSGCHLFIDPDKIYNDPEVMPQPRQGSAAFESYITQNLKYPEAAKKEGISGTVLVEFVVTKSGMLRDMKILEGLGHGCDEESIRVLRESDAWQPGEDQGQAVNVRLVLPIQFILDNDS